MGGVRKRIAQGLVAAIVVCALGFMICGSFASPGNEWERACIGLVAVMVASMVAALGLAATTYLGLRSGVKRHLDRPALSDEEFVARLGDDPDLDPALVGEVRALAVRCFGRLRADRFYPEDRLEEDLHVRDLAPFAARSFCGSLEGAYDLGEDALRCRMATGSVATFGDLVQAAVYLIEDAGERPVADQPDRAGPVWDPGLDG